MTHAPADHVHADGSTHHQHGQLGHGAPVLDIGGDIGALVLYTDSDLEGLEIEVSVRDRSADESGDESGRRTHTEILRRTVGGRTFWAGVYSQLPEGDYRIWFDEAPGRTLEFSIAGGSVTELDWRH
jgi:hypothetical protein